MWLLHRNAGGSGKSAMGGLGALWLCLVIQGAGLFVQAADINYVNYGSHYNVTVRQMSSGTTNLNYLPIATSVKITLEGDIPDNKYIAFVHKSNVGCNNGNNVVAGADSDRTAVFQGVGKEFDIDTSTLTGTGDLYRLCYNLGTGVGTEQWKNSIQSRFSVVPEVQIYGRRYRTEGYIPAFSALKLQYTGAGNGKWLSIIPSSNSKTFLEPSLTVR